MLLSGDNRSLSPLEQKVEELVAFAADQWIIGDGDGGYIVRLLFEAAERQGLRHRLGATKTGRNKQKIRYSLAKKVFERDKYRCVVCGDHRDLTCDHIFPESLGGETTLENLQAMCRPCNSRKGSKV